jgi:hypothetical protein
MKRVTITSISIVLVLFGLICSSAYGQEKMTASDNWQISFNPYIWFLSLDAEGTVSGNLRSFSGDVDLGFDDIVDYLDFGAMGRVEAWKGKWGLTFDGLFINLSADKSFQGRLANSSLDADLRIGMADFGLAYRLF